MNRARQDAITTEIMEIVGGAEALGGDGSHDGGVETALASMLLGTDASVLASASAR